MAGGDSRREPVRLHVPDAHLSTEQLTVLGEVARRYGMGFVQFGARKRVEIPGVAYADIRAVRNALDAAGIGVAKAGTGRCVTVCAGQDRCPHAFADIHTLASRLREVLRGDGYPGPVRISLSCCNRLCSAPQAADIGFVGLVDPVLDRSDCQTCGLCASACEEGALIMRRGLPRRDPRKCTYCGACVAACTPRALKPGRIGYTVYVGGKAGSRPQPGVLVARFLPGDEAPELVSRILAFVGEHARPREQVHSVLRRVGIESLQARLALRMELRPPAPDASA